MQPLLIVDVPIEAEKCQPVLNQRHPTSHIHSDSNLSALVPFHIPGGVLLFSLHFHYTTLCLHFFFFASAISKSPL